MDTHSNDTLRTRARRPWLLALAFAFVLPAAACAPEADDTAEGNLDTEEQMAEAPRGDIDRTAEEQPMAERGERADAERIAGDAEGETTAQLTIRQSDEYGEYIVRGDGTPVYLFTADTQGESSACYDDCAHAWPPVTGVPAAGTNVDAELLGSITREDGTMQATYNGWPLYEFARDSGNEPTGQDMQGFGGEWYLIGPDGEEVHAETQ